MPFARDSRNCSTRPATISALPRRTGRRRSSGSRRSPTWWWSSARRTHTTPPGWRRSHVTSAPEILVQGVLGWLGERGFDRVEEIRATEEVVRFALPRELGREYRASQTMAHAIA